MILRSVAALGWDSFLGLQEPLFRKIRNTDHFRPNAAFFFSEHHYGTDEGRQLAQNLNLLFLAVTI